MSGLLFLTRLLLSLTGCVLIPPSEKFWEDGETECGAEVWYDGVDGDCLGGDDYDADVDGHATADVVQADGSVGDDCWDDPSTQPEGFVAVPGAVQLFASEVYPGAVDVWYDGIDGDCSGGSDFDQDLDGEDDANHPQVDGALGGDCYDEVDPDCILPEGATAESEPDCSYPLSGVLVGTPFAPEQILPGILDAPYDGTDQDCGGNSDYDADGDGADRADECDDTDPTVFPNPEIEQIWYNGIDENCTGNDGDQDGDGYYAADYPFPDLIPLDYLASTGDCWDDPAGGGTWQVINGFPDLSAAEVYPGAEDVWYDGIDGDCAGDDDFDADHDTHNTEVWPDRVGGYGDDCDDARGDMYPGAVDTWYDGDDSDCAGNDDFDQDYDTYASDGYGGGDCDDGNDAVHPNRDELCSTVDDDNCDGGTNDVDATGCAVFYSDLDGDSHGGPNEQCTCVEEGAYVYTVSDDCDDANPAAYPSAPETTGNEVDEDCNRGEICFVDADNDEFRTTTGTTVVSVDVDCDDSGEAALTLPASDCNDVNAAINPAATEQTGDNVDQDCDGSETCYVDSDDDTYRTPTGSTVVSMDADCDDSGEAFTTDLPTDCNDLDAAINPGATETVGNSIDENCDGAETCYVDADSDNYRNTTGATVASVDADCADAGEGLSSEPATDCNDASASIHPGATELAADGIDENCDGWEGCYVDEDNDAFRTTTGDDVASADLDCDDDGEGASTEPATDCDDADSTIHPGATEGVGDNVDQDCSGGETCYVDADSDSYRNTTGTTVASADTDCADAGEGLATEPATDCNDANAAINPAASEGTGDNVDQNCDGAEICYVDADNDNYRTTTGSTVASADADCTDSGEAISTDPATDCNDANSAIKPGATELTGDGVDQNCDGAETCFVDADNDNYRTMTGSTVASADSDCSDPGEAVSTDNATDCNDANATISPGASETIGDGVDQDCSGQETCYVDADDDTYRSTSGTTLVSADLDCTDAGEAVAGDPATDCDDASAYVKPGAVELCDGIKNDCDDAGWTASYEDGTASTVTTGVWADITTSVAGSAGSPASYTLPTAATTTVWFCPGTFYVHLTATNSSSTVSGRGAAADVILDADGSGPVLDATGSSSSVLTLTDFTLTNGTGKLATDLYGGAIYATAASSHTGGTTMLVLDGCEVTNSAADYGGGIALANRASITLTDSRVYDNSAAINGGGLWIQQGAAICEATIAGTFGVYFNDAVTKGGGAYLANSSSATLDSVSCDWGTTLGVDENVIGGVANDVDVTYNSGGAVNSYAAYGSSATFSCLGGSTGGCTP